MLDHLKAAGIIWMARRAELASRCRSHVDASTDERRARGFQKILKRPPEADALWQPTLPRSAPPVPPNGREKLMLRCSDRLFLLWQHRPLMVACAGSMVASPGSRGGVPTHDALVTGRSQRPGRPCSWVVLRHSRS